MTTGRINQVAEQLACSHAMCAQTHNGHGYRLKEGGTMKKPHSRRYYTKNLAHPKFSNWLTVARTEARQPAPVHRRKFEQDTKNTASCLDGIDTTLCPSGCP